VARGTKARRPRPNGDGSIYKTEDGRWRGVVDPGWIDGRCQRKYVSGGYPGPGVGARPERPAEAETGVVTDDRLIVGQVLQVRGAVQRMEAGQGDRRRVSDAVEDRRLGEHHLVVERHVRPDRDYVAYRRTAGDQACRRGRPAISRMGGRSVTGASRVAVGLRCAPCPRSASAAP
jgi:hypothetical protein